MCGLPVGKCLNPTASSEPTGEERDRLYQQMVAMWSSYRMYERHAGREIPAFGVTTVS